MLFFAEIPPERLPELLAIDARSNAYAWSAESLSSCYKQYANLGLFCGEDLVAFVFYHRFTNEGEIIHLVCDQKSQGQGYAYRLFSHLIEQNRQQHQIDVWHLEVRAGNDDAIRLYQRLGFVPVGRRKAYYQHKEDAVLMRLSVP